MNIYNWRYNADYSFFALANYVNKIEKKTDRLAGRCIGKKVDQLHVRCKVRGNVTSDGWTCDWSASSRHIMRGYANPLDKPLNDFRVRVRPHYARFVVIRVLFVKKKSLANWHEY